MENKMNINTEKNLQNKNIQKVIYNDSECLVLNKNKNELLLKVDTIDYLSGKNVTIKQWVDIKAVKLID